jgi:glycosyltransferase involved in cell wall biosynthesis
VPERAVSIVLPTFNRLRYLSPTIDSVFAQTFADWELVIADDGSQGHTRAYLRELERAPRVRVLWLPHIGIPAAVRNAGLRAATGTYIAFLDSDDLWAPRKLEAQLAALRAQPDRRWCYCAFTQIDGQNELLNAERWRRWTPHAGEIFAQTVTTEAALRTPCVTAQRRLLAEVGGFDESLPSSEDFDLWMRLALRSPVALVDEPLVQVRRHEANYSLDWAIAYLGRERSLKKLESDVDLRLRPLLRRERARNAATLLIEHARRGEGRQALRALLRSAPYSWPQPVWWWGAIRAAARLYRPKSPRP